LFAAPGGANPFNVGALVGGGKEAINLLNHGLPDAIATKLNKLPPASRQKALMEILMKYSQQPYSPFTTQLAAGNGNE